MRLFFYRARGCEIMFWYAGRDFEPFTRTRFLPSAHAANMADETFLEFLRKRRLHVFPQKIRKSTFLSTALQKNRERRRYSRLLFILSVLACTCTERRFWKLTRSGQWFEPVDTAFTEKEWYDSFRVSNSTFELIHCRRDSGRNCSKGHSNA